MERKDAVHYRKYTASLPSIGDNLRRRRWILSGSHHMIHGETELLEEPVTGGRRAVVVNAHAAASVAHVLGPAEGRASLDGDASLDVRQDYRVAVLGVLSGEPLQAGQRDNASANPFGRESLLDSTARETSEPDAEQLDVYGAGGESDST